MHYEPVHLLLSKNKDFSWLWQTLLTEDQIAAGPLMKASLSCLR